MVKLKKLKASTLPEVLIAIVIISFISVIGVTIYLNVQNSTQPFIKLKANEIALKYLLLTETNKEYFDKTYTEEEFVVNKSIKIIQAYPDCIDVKIIINTKQQKKIVELHKVLYAK